MININKATDSYVTSGLDNGGVFSSKEYRESSVTDRIRLIRSSIELWEDDIVMKSKEVLHLKEFGNTKNYCSTFSSKERQDFSVSDKISLMDLDIGQKKQHLTELNIELNYLTQKYL